MPQEEPTPLVKKLMEWREKNHLSQRQAAAVLQRYGCPISETAVRAWENGRRVPRARMEKAVEAVIDQHPTITDAPRFGRWVKDE